MALPELLAGVPAPGLVLGALAALLLAVRIATVLLSRRPAPRITVSLTEAEANDVIDAPVHEVMALQDPSRPGMLQCFDPSTMQRLGEVPDMTPEDVDAAIARARAAQPAWAKTSFAERRRVLRTMLDWVSTHQKELCRVASRDSGKTKVDAIFGEVLTTCEKLRCVIANGEQWLAPEYRPAGPLMMHKNAYVEYRPLGVIATIAPFNYVVHNFWNHVISGLFAGNAVVVKVSEWTSWSADFNLRAVRAALAATGHDPELVQLVTGLVASGKALVDGDVDKVVFTGSPEVGRHVMAGASKHLTPVILELGGKDPFIVCEDASPAAVMPMAMRGVFQNAGQNCCGVERVYAYASVYDEFVDLAERNVRALVQGNPLGAQRVDVGAMIMPRQLEIIQELVDDAVAKGARLLVGGKRNAALAPGIFYEPTLLVDVDHTMRIANEEVFGPVMTVVRVPGDSDEECLRMVNSTAYGLGSAVFSNNDARATRLAERIRCGMSTVNDFGVNYLVQALPFGGVKASGFDRFGGPEGLRGLCLQKSVVVDKSSFMRTTIPAPLQYPITSKGGDFAEAMVGLFYSPDLSGRARSLWTLATA